MIPIRKEDRSRNPCLREVSVILEFEVLVVILLTEPQVVQAINFIITILNCRYKNNPPKA